MPSATPPVRLLKAAIRGLLGLVAAGILYFSAAATTVWFEVAKATFDSVKDGPVDGKNCVSELGKFAPVPSEDPSAAAIAGGRLVLTTPSSPSGSYGVEFAPTAPAQCGAIVSFTFETKSDLLDVSIASTDAADCCPGGVDDGTTTELLCVEVDGNQLLVNGRPSKVRIDKGVAYRVDVGLYEGDDKAGLYDILITNLVTGEFEAWSDVLAVPYLPVDSVRFTKDASRPGDVFLDNLSILAPSK